MNKIALDTNILIYNHQLTDVGKRSIANALLAQRPFVSTQAISEYLNVMKRLLPVAKTQLLKLCADWMQECEIRPVYRDTVTLAEKLVAQYDFQIFDAIIVASALESDCQTLYSEDMQHGMMIARQLTIINPFI